MVGLAPDTGEPPDFSEFVASDLGLNGGAFFSFKSFSQLTIVFLCLVLSLLIINAPIGHAVQIIVLFRVQLINFWSR